MYRGSQGAVVGKKARTFKVCATLGCTETFNPFRALWRVEGELMVLVGLLFFFCVKRTPVCVWLCAEYKTSAGDWRGCGQVMIVAVRPTGLFPHNCQGSRLEDRLVYLPVASHPPVKHGQPHHTWILFYLMISEGFPSTLRVFSSGVGATLGSVGESLCCSGTLRSLCSTAIIYGTKVSRARRDSLTQAESECAVTWVKSVGLLGIDTVDSETWIHACSRHERNWSYMSINYFFRSCRQFCLTFYCLLVLSLTIFSILLLLFLSFGINKNRLFA